MVNIFLICKGAMFNLDIDNACLDLVAYDFDGVMTNNLVYLLQDGREIVSCNRSDGLAVGMLRDAGLQQIILSTEPNPVVMARAKKLSLHAIHGCSDKRKALIDYCDQNDYDLAKVIFVGNDLNDKAVMQAVGYPICPSDAHNEIKEISCFITKAAGGAGVIRELADLILKKCRDKK